MRAKGKRAKGQKQKGKGQKGKRAKGQKGKTTNYNFPSGSSVIAELGSLQTMQ